MKITDTTLDPHEIIYLKNLIHKYEDIFSAGDHDIGHNPDVRHRINLLNERSFKQKHRRIPPAMIDEVRSHSHQLLASGIIRKTYSPWSSHERNFLRMCIDYRQINQRTIKDSYALPRINDTLDSFSGAKYFTVLDMKGDYH